MQVILLEKIHNLGELGDAVKVKPGFARNYLIPNGKATMATPENIEAFEARRAELERAAGEVVAKAKTRAEKLEGMRVTITRKAGDEGRLFGSVGGADIAEALTAAGVEVAKSEVRLHADSLRQTGEHEVGVHVHADVEATITVVVEAEA